jgi:hypothetical protein
MPADKDQGSAPVPPHVDQPDPKQSISGAKKRTCARARQGGQLLTQREILQSHGSMSAADQADGSKEDDERRQHAR